MPNNTIKCSLIALHLTSRLQVLDELCGGDVADAVGTGGTHSLPEPTKHKLSAKSVYAIFRVTCLSPGVG